MGAITPAMRAEYGQPADWIPAKVLERIDNAEILDRLDEARDLIHKADHAAPDLVWGYRDRAREVCAAEPRDDVERRAQQWITKAEQATTAVHAETCRAEARSIRNANPPAPRRPRTRPPTAEEVRHAEWVASLKAEINAQVRQQTRGRLEALESGVHSLTATVADLTKAAQ
ncbi:hypothetical protein [Streptomyces sp. NPDC088736]|uniref:hypothetical protein n=1 Tax=Streptomyces sp. NPDC088736 TaxID=3365881 RepID=UPI003808D5A0